MLTVYEAMQRRADELAWEREREAAERRQAAHELAVREAQVADLVREYVAATQDFAIDGLDVHVSESEPRTFYRVSFRFPGQDGCVRTTFYAKKGELRFRDRVPGRRRNRRRRRVHGCLSDARRRAA